MVNVSNAFLEKMQDSTSFYCTGTMTLGDGTEIVLTADDFVLGGTSYRDGAEATGLPLGAAICRSVEIELMNDDGRFDDVDFFAAQISLDVALDLEDSTTERIGLGVFTVNAPATYGDTIIIEALDPMWRADQPYTTTLTFPATLSALYRDLCVAAGIPFHTAEIRNGGFVVSNMPAEKYTIREMLGFVAMLAGGNARVGRDGYMQILEYDFSALSGDSPDLHTLDLWTASSLGMDANDVVITGVQTTIPGDEENEEETLLIGESGYVLDVENPLMQGGDGLRLIAAVMVGGRFRKFNGSHVAYPLAEFMDPVKIIDRKGNAYYSILTDLEFVVGGKTELSNSADSPARAASRYASPAQTAVAVANRLVARERAARQAQVEQINANLKNASGMFETVEVQEDGSLIRYLHDRKTLAGSSTVLKLTSAAIGISNDGGKNYTYALAFTGEAVLQTLAAEGVQADWIIADDLSAVSAKLAGWNIDDYGISKTITTATNKKIKVALRPPAEDLADGEFSSVLSCVEIDGNDHKPLFDLYSNGAIDMAEGRMRFDPEIAHLTVANSDIAPGTEASVASYSVSVSDNDGNAWMRTGEIGNANADSDSHITPGHIQLKRDNKTLDLSPYYIAFEDEKGNLQNVMDEINARVKKSGDTMTGALKVSGTISSGEKTSANDGKPGVAMGRTGYIMLQRGDSGKPYISFYMQGATTGAGTIQTSGSAMEFRSGGRYDFDARIDSTGNIRFGAASPSTQEGLVCYWADGSTHPIVGRNGPGLEAYFGWAGSSSYKTVTEIRGQTCKYTNSSGTTTLSDERLKKDFVDLTNWERFYDRLEPVAFRLRNGNSGRYHMGFKAQQIREALESSGLTTQDFAGYLEMTHRADPDNPEGEAAYEAAGIKDGDTELGLIYTEFVALNTHMIKQLRAEVAALKDEVSQLKAQLAEVIGG